jgi:hypothetical protein
MEPTERQDGQSPTRAWPVQLLRTGLLLVIVAILLFGALFWTMHLLMRRPLAEVEHPETGYVFPDPQDIESVRLRFPGGEGIERVRDCEVPKSSWSKIISCLTPSQLDPRPAKWDKIGVMTIRTHTGQKLRVGLFHIDEPVGAFNVDADSGKRHYYRGGNSEQLRKAMTAAYAESKKSLGTADSVR